MLSEYTRASAVVILLSGLTLRTHRTSWHPILREVRGCVEAGTTLLSLVAVKLTRRWTILAPLYTVSSKFISLPIPNLRCTSVDDH